MGILDDEFAADAAEILRDVGRTVTFRGEELPAQIATQAVGMDIETGGLAVTGGITVKLLRTSVSRAVRVGEKLTCEDTVYKIDAITPAPRSPWIILNCSADGTA